MKENLETERGKGKMLTKAVTNGTRILGLKDCEDAKIPAVRVELMLIHASLLINCVFALSHLLYYPMLIFPNYCKKLSDILLVLE